MTDDDVMSLPLRGGRALAYREYGDPHGAPVIHCHGGLVCGLDAQPYDAAARDLGLRIIAPDRPGIGRSRPAPGRTTIDWAADVADLLDTFGITQTAVLGWSMGGQYALACGAALGALVSRVTVVAGALPLDDESTFGELNAMDRRFTRVAQHHPSVARDMFRSLGEIAHRTPAAWQHLTSRGAAPDEATALHDWPEHGLAHASAVALEHGDGMVEEYRAWARPWGFAPEDVAAPVTLFQGDADDLVPAAWATTLARRIPNATLDERPGEGHFLGFAHPVDVLRTLL